MEGKNLIVVYGGYRHRQNSTGVTISSSVLENEAGVPYRVQTDINIEGRLRNSRLGNSRSMDPIIREMEIAYSAPGQDFGILHDDGTKSSVWFENSATIGGIKPTMLAYPNYRGGELINYRQFQIQLRVLTQYGAPLQYTRFSETISIQGGGELYAVKEVNYGRGVRQRVRTHTKCTATQSGTAVRHGLPPEIPPPIWPFALKEQHPRITKVVRPRGGTRTRNLSLDEIEIGWTYEYEWVDRLDGIPHYAIG